MLTFCGWLAYEVVEMRTLVSEIFTLGVEMLTSGSRCVPWEWRRLPWGSRRLPRGSRCIQLGRGASHKITSSDSFQVDLTLAFPCWNHFKLSPLLGLVWAIMELPLELLSFFLFFLYIYIYFSFYPNPNHTFSVFIDNVRAVTSCRIFSILCTT